MTTDEAGLCELPLLVTGLPAAARDCLRAGGVPFVTAEAGERSRRSRGASPRFVLYDSRDAGSRRDAEALKRQGLQSIDVAPHLARAVDRPSPAGDDSDDGARRLSCVRLLPFVKQAIENADGLWARVPEVPFPWHYDAASWHPAPAELLAWRKTRARIRVQIVRTPETWKITAAGDFSGFRPALELWRGRHFASFELHRGETTLPLSGLVYQQSVDRLADPVPAARTDDSHITINSGWVKPQSA
jgi:hypothetical protein